MPICGKLRHRKMHGLATPLWHVHEDHRRIDEGMLGIELRGKGARFIPVRGVRKFDRARALDTPRLLVHFFDECLLQTGRCLHLLHVTAEVANLVERIPRRHLHKHFASHIGNGHRYVEEMPLGMIQEDGILNCCSGRRTEREDR